MGPAIQGIRIGRAIHELEEEARHYYGMGDRAAEAAYRAGELSAYGYRDAKRRAQDRYHRRAKELQDVAQDLTDAFPKETK